MSGPKVVRIVTREEILDICHGMLARVDAALAEWTRIGERNDCIDDAALAAARARRAELAELIAADRFMDLQKQAPIEEAFLRDDVQVRLAKVAAEQAAARSRNRREREAAASLLRALRAGGEALDANLERGLERGDAAALAEGFRVLAARTAAPAASRALADRLRLDGPPASFADWLASRPAVDTDPAVARIDARIAELAPLVDGPAVADWTARLDEAADAEPARRSLLLDGLDVATGRALTEARARAAAVLDLGLLAAEMRAADLDAVALAAGVEDLGTEAIAARVAEGRAALDAHRRALSSAARRTAVLEGLAGLGYEVTEGMRTTWVEEGRLVVRSATRPDYGVEVSAAGERMQMRPVAFDAGGVGPDPSRDRDAETIWCGDVSALQAGLGDAGGGLVIERALSVGATPLKRIAVEALPDAGAAVEVPALRGRTLR
ncbi:hypothetical protein [Sphingomonas kyeonggiensis]|uniref:Uncharacterized protein n=1 Tax=Sphingomonas kyeonggiensis TaxID=1268553 RepID=A0A7W6NWZ0_9SPHN|nr:hypothetical protein [Sphingomonas kyeonggiensis]MBB4098004.1 hypothetical protein [Sphingomonas kyeonggiensis]